MDITPVFLALIISVFGYKMYSKAVETQLERDKIEYVQINEQRLRLIIAEEINKPTNI
jgi:hypothetical protein